MTQPESTVGPNRPAGTVKIDWQRALAEHDRWLRTVALAPPVKSRRLNEIMQEVLLAAVRQRCRSGRRGQGGPLALPFGGNADVVVPSPPGPTAEIDQGLRPVDAAQRAESPRARPAGLADRRGIAGNWSAKALSRLLLCEAEILLLKYTEDCSYHELASRLGASQLRRADPAAPGPAEVAGGIGRVGGDGSRTMSLPHEESPLDDLDFDLLVDGELSEQRRGELLGRLDRVPDGWRRCALAFLEAQSWTEDLRAMRQESPATVSARRLAGQRGLPWSGLRTVLAMAACFLVALGLGAYFRGFWGPLETTVDLPQTAASLPSTSPGRPAAPRGSADLRSPVSPEVWQTVAVPVADGSGDGAESLRLPARVADQLDPDWLEGVPPAVPRDVIAARASGHEVQEQRQLVPLPLQDGRRLVVPVDQVEVRYVGNSGYQ